MLSKQAKAELEKKLQSASEFLTDLMISGDSGIVTIGYGPAGLRIGKHRHEKSTPVQPILEPTAEAKG
jgi:hypothetical protein